MTTFSLVMGTLAEWDMWITATYGQGVSSGTCALLICSLPGSVLECFHQLSSIICYSGKYHRQYGCGLAAPPDLVAYSGEVVPILFYFSLWMLSEVTVSGETVRCSDISHVPRLVLAVLDSCLPHKSGLLPLKALHSLAMGTHLAAPQKSAYGGRCPFDSIYSSSRECTFS